MTGVWAMQCPHCDETANYQTDGPHDYVCPNGHASKLIDEPNEVLHPQPYRAVTREELLAFLDDAEHEDTLPREEVREAILAAWDIAVSLRPGSMGVLWTTRKNDALERFRSVVGDR